MRAERLTPEQMKAWVAKSRAAQGLGPTVTDPVALDKVARLLLATPAPKTVEQVSGGLAS